MTTEIKTEVVVLGSGPAGYSAAFRCADLGLKVTMVEKYTSLGGVCLNVGCIPSKALLHITTVLDEARELSENGVEFGEPKFNLDKIREWKDNSVGQLTKGVANMAKSRKVEVVQGIAEFIDSHSMKVSGTYNESIIKFDHAIIAAGSRPVKLPFIPHEDPRIWDSTDALALRQIPKNLLIMGGGIIGLEMGTVYHALGANIDVVEMAEQVIPAADRDIIKIYTKTVS